MKLNLLFLAFVIFLTESCTGQKTINLVPHDFNKIPTKIVWFQIGGLSEDHISLIKYSRPLNQSITSFEKFNCYGKMWTFNLYDLRPSSSSSSLTQFTGQKNIKNQCSDFEHRPIWDYLKSLGYETGILEVGGGLKGSLEKAYECENKKNYYKDKLFLWRMDGKGLLKDKKYFHYLDSKIIKNYGVFYDKSCQKDLCFSSLFSNVKSLYDNFYKSRILSLFIVKENNYEKYLREKNINKARETLFEIEKVLAYFDNFAQKDQNMLILVTTTNPIGLDFPKEGRKWAEFEKKGKNLFYKERRLLSSVFAKGASSENFCGIFQERDLFKRLIWNP